ncbi:DNA-binding protein [Actinobacillus succinogenes]|uniref:Helix-turn-helix domain protein n=1 Tax=Actinobacillus succinogenes (strain ATCC 55618 / DSM 22257 / CCUG 43843 / 130Z) TaxID=339671 RepID=A6VQX7_ACTSZ|nr:RodZ family helix-turn-helix domain-containing protein [Actinobacillus succinogenes]ABR75374.1 helix-turn-helix domain protein [Actinobacillus succinogenes 130Z]PHI40237.1 DNA-binding protein [Actinobacillus succinogenes]
MDTEEKNVAALGEQFRQARENLGLSLEEAAKKLNLRVQVLQFIENNEFAQKSIPATFMQGYVRSYAKLVKLPESIWRGAVPSFGDMPKNDLSRAARIDKAINPHSSHNNRWIGYFTAIILLFVAGMTALWWWENYQQSNKERETLVQNYTPVETTSVQSKDLLPAVQVPVNPSDTAAETLMQSERPTASTIESGTVSTDTNSTQSSVESLTAQNNVESAVENSDDSQPAAAPVAADGDLQIEITAATSWISVKDAKRKVLAQKEYRQGETLNFKDGAPYAVIIGAPSNVKITYKGENYPLKVDGRVAKFKLQ